MPITASAPTGKPDPDEIRSRAILRDIYARHGIDAGVPPEEAAQMIAEKAPPQSGWANPQEWADAREKYALASNGDPLEVQARWDKSKYLMDPASHESHQKYGRDADFAAGVGATTRFGGVDTTARSSALRRWDQSNNNPLYRDSWKSSGIAGEDSFGGGAGAAITNPDNASGAFMQAMDVPLHTLQMAGSGEAGLLDSLNTASGNYYHAHRHRLDSRAPILDLPASASPEARNARIAELQAEAAKAAVPDSAERWQRTLGFTPAPFVRDMGDAVLGSVDPTMLIPFAGAAKPLGAAAKIAGSGWMKKAALDQAAEQATTAGLMGLLGGNDPNRTWTEYFSPMTTPAALKSDAEVRDANAARQSRFNRSVEQSSQPGVSAAADEAYSRLRNAGKVPVGRL